AVRGAARPATRVAELATGAIWGKLQIVGVLAVAAGLMVGIALNRDDARANPQSPPAKQIPPKVADKPAAREAKDPRSIAGRVLGADGRPAPGAKVWIVEPWQKAREVARSAADGTFRLPADDPKRSNLTESEYQIRIVATHEKFGVALPSRKPGDELALRLVEDLPVRGRVLDLQGKPVAGATITTLRTEPAQREPRDDWRAKLRAAGEQANIPTDPQLRRKVAPAPFLAPVQTDAAGRFTLTGVGRERLLELRVEGPT